MNCYRHSDREAYVRCQRCERYICPACQTEAAVGFLCPEDSGVSAATRVVNKAPRQVRKLFASDSLVTTTLIALCVVIWVLQILPGSLVTNQLAYAPFVTPFEPWRMITTGFLHSTSSPFHLLLNMYSLYIFGRALEPMLGALRFLWLYLISLLGGSVAVLWMMQPTDWTVGASGAIFGLMGAYFVVARSLGYSSNQFVGLIAINLAFGFLIPGIAWQAHLGGLIAGMAVAGAYSITRGLNKQVLQRVYLLGIFAALVVITFAGVAVKLAGIY